MDTDERMHNLKIDSERSAEFFLEHHYSKACDIAEEISRSANEQHEINCPNDEVCRGVTPYILKGLKEYFLAHPELDEMVRLAIAAELFHYIGATTMIQKMEMTRRRAESGDSNFLDDIIDSMPLGPDNNDKD